MTYAALLTTNLWRKTVEAFIFRYLLKAVIITIIIIVTIVTTFCQAQVHFISISRLTKA